MNSRKDGTGCLNYSDFSLWLGTEIHNLATFVFRHDSKRNPSFENYQQEQEKKKGMDKKAAMDAHTTDDDLMRKIINKIQNKWSTVRKAFKDFNIQNG